MNLDNILSIYDTSQTYETLLNNIHKYNPKVTSNIRDFIVQLLLLKFKLNCLNYYVLVVDTKSYEYLRRMFTKSDIMYVGIVEIYDLNAAKYQIHLPCIYFIEPTVENLSKIAEDISEKLYTQYSICFNGTSENLRQDHVFKKINLKKITLLGDFLTFNMINENILLHTSLDNLVEFLTFFKFEPVMHLTENSQKLKNICENINKQIKIKNPNSSLIMLERSFDILPLLLYSFTIESLYDELINQQTFIFEAKKNNGEFHNESFDIKDDLLFNKHKHEHFVDILNLIYDITHQEKNDVVKYEEQELMVYKRNELSKHKSLIDIEMENADMEIRKKLREKKQIENEKYVRHYFKYINMINKLTEICKDKNIREASLIQQRIIFGEISTLGEIYALFDKTLFDNKVKVRILVLMCLKYPKYIKQMNPARISPEIIVKTQQIVMNLQDKFKTEVFDSKYVELLKENNDNYDTSLYIPKICHIIENALINVYHLEPFDITHTYEFRRQKSTSQHKKNKTLIVYVEEFMTYFELNSIQNMMKNKYPHINLVIVSDSIKNYNDLF